MNKAIFLDRDGVINKERKDYVKSINELEIYDGVSEAIKIIKENGYLAIIITNQSAINRKIITQKKLEEIHQYLQDFLKSKKTQMDAIYFCPHRPDEKCNCRKPKAGMFLKASVEYDIELEKSIMIGDSITDIQAAQTSGCKHILLENGDTLLEIVRKLFNT